MAKTESPRWVVANWKMNGSLELVDDTLFEFQNAENLIVCPPAPYLPLFIESEFPVGAQNCGSQFEGACTGEVSVQHLYDVGCTHVILGHSERRQYHGETDKVVQQKAALAIQVGLTPIICIGESQAEREEGRTRQSLLAQLVRSTYGLKSHQYIVAYEPVWAIGSGKLPSATEIEEVVHLIKEERSSEVLYGGSVSDQNAHQLSQITDLDGVLVGGASLELGKLKTIVSAFS